MLHRGAPRTGQPGVAQALQLDEAERAHLFDLVRTANARRVLRRRPSQERVRPAVQRILDSMTKVPAYVRNSRLDILAANRLGHALYADVSSAISRSATRHSISPAMTVSGSTSTPPNRSPSYDALKLLASWSAQPAHPNVTETPSEPHA